MTQEQFFSRIMNEVQPMPNSHGQVMTRHLLMEFADWGLFRLQDEDSRYKFYDAFYKAYYSGQVKTVDDVAAICAKFLKG